METVFYFLILLVANWANGEAVDRKEKNLLQNELSNTRFQVQPNALTYLHNGNPLKAFSSVSQARRLPFMLPVMYNLGVITTLLVVLTFLMFKGLTLGVIILILNLNGKGLKHAAPSRPVHIHVHGGMKEPYYVPDWDRIDDPDANQTEGYLSQIFNPRHFNK